MASTAGSDRGVPVPSLRMSLTLAHQSKIRSMYCSRQSLASQENGSSPASEMGHPSAGHVSGSSTSNYPSSRPDSSSSATSSVADWESGLSTVRRQPPPLPGSNSRKVEEVSAYSNESSGVGRLRVGTMAKAFDQMHNGTSESRSRSRFKPPSGFNAGLKKHSSHHSGAVMDEETGSMTKSSSKNGPGSTRSGSVDTLDRLSVRSEMTKTPHSQIQAVQQQQVSMQQQRRRHRSVERQLDHGSVERQLDHGSADSNILLDSSEEPGSARVNERFSAAVFHHSKPGKLVMAKAAAAGNTRTLHKTRGPAPIPAGPALKMGLAIDPIHCNTDHEADGRNGAIYSLRPCDPSDLLGANGGVQLSHNAGSSRSIQVKSLFHFFQNNFNQLNFNCFSIGSHHCDADEPTEP